MELPAVRRLLKRDVVLLSIQPHFTFVASRELEDGGTQTMA